MKTSSLFLLILILSISPIYAVPELPMIISGDAYINDKPAGIGTEITVMANGEEINKIQTTETGKFNLILQKLANNQSVDFYVDGISANESISYKSGDFKQLSLKVEKSYLVYYFGVTLLLLIGAGIIWKGKSTKKRKR
ncbi:MAG: hypothetical protein ABIJ14_03545 [Nanoarchaeota archaeon]